MIDKITTGTVVAAAIGVLFGVMFDMVFLRPLQDTVSIRETAHPQPRYVTPFELGCSTKPRADDSQFLNNAPSACIKGASSIGTPQAAP